MLFELRRATPPTEVRNATAEDASAIERLYAQLEPPGSGVSVNPDRLADIAADPATLLLVVEHDGDIVGTALLTICLDAMFGNQPFGVVDNIIVDAAGRSSGAGKVLLEAIEHVALREDCSKVILLSSRPRVGAHAFFKALGYDGNAERGFVKDRTALEATARRV